MILDERWSKALGTAAGLVLLWALLGFGASSAAAQTPASKPWFDEVQGVLELSEEDERELLDSARSAVLGSPRAKSPTGLLATDTQPRIVFLSISDGQSKAMVSLGTGAGLAEAIADAARKLRERFAPGFSPLWFKLDVVREVVVQEKVDPKAVYAWERSLYGMAFERTIGLAFLPEELVAATLIDSDQEIRLSRIPSYVEREDLQSLTDVTALKLFAFRTHSLFSSGDRVVRLFRGHPVYSDVSAEDVLAAARRAGHYLTSEVGSDGRFTYAFRPKTNEDLEEYNILRHAGTIYAMLELYELTSSDELLRAVKRAMGFLTTCIHLDPADPLAACVVEDGYTKLGGNGLAAVAIAKYEELTGDLQHHALLQMLGRRICAQVDADGQTIRHKVAYPDGTDSGFVSDFYPGQAILALALIAKSDPEGAYVEAAARAAKYLIERDEDVRTSQLEHDHWLLYALDALHRVQPDPLYVEHTRRLASAITKQQIRKADPVDWLGGYNRPPSSTPTATRLEGLCAAWRLLTSAGAAAEAAECFETVRLGVHFLLQTQFGPESSLYLKDPDRVQGAFHEGLSNYEIRIDYVQHAISALLGYHRMLLGGTPPTPPASRTLPTVAEYPAWIKAHLANREWKTRGFRPKLNREILQQSFRLGRSFLIHHQKPEGNFNYQYDFVKRSFDPGDNSVRQAGATWSLALLFQYEQDPENRVALDNALRFFFAHSEPGPVEGSQIIAYPGETDCSTGTVSLVALAIIEILRTEAEGKVALEEPWEGELRARLSGYLSFLKFMRLDSGHFSQELTLKSRSRSPEVSPYSDGEALLCWTKAARYLEREDLRPLIEESALTMARDYTAAAWQSDSDSADTKGFFQWGCMAFFEYQDAGWSQAAAIADTIVSLAWWMVHTHDTLGRPRNTAYAYEGIIPAYRIARSREDAAAMNDLAYTIDTGLTKLTSWQVGGPLMEQNPYLQANPTEDPLGVGGVMNQGNQAPLRIDVTQHQMHAVILAIQHVYRDS